MVKKYRVGGRAYETLNIDVIVDETPEDPPKDEKPVVKSDCTHCRHYWVSPGGLQCCTALKTSINKDEMKDCKQFKQF